MGGRKLMLELLEALAEAWGAIEQELWSLSSCNLRWTEEAQNHQKETGKSGCATA